MWVYSAENVLTVLTYIALNALEILMSSINSIDIYSNDGMVGRPLVSAFQNFLLIENRLNIKKVMGSNVWMCFVLTVLTYITLNALEILMSSIDSIDIYSNDGMVEKSSVSAFQNFLRIENWLDIKKVMGRNMRMCFVQSRVEFSHLIVLCIGCCERATNTSVLTVSTNIAFNAFACFDLHINSVNKHTIHNSIALILCIDCLSMLFNVHTTDKVTVSGFLTI